MLGVGIDEAVGALGSAHLVIIDFLIFVLGGKHALLGLVVSAVIEAFAVGAPGGSREFGPLDAVVEQTFALGLHDVYLDPVRARCGRSEGEVFAVFRERGGGQGYRSVVGQLVGVEEYLGFGLGVGLPVDDVLILQTVVTREVEPVAFFRGGTLFGVVPQLGQTLFDGLAEGNLRQVVEGHFVFGLYPGGRRFGAVVLEPAVVVGNLCAEVVVGHVAALGFGVGQMFYFLHLITI